MGQHQQHQHQQHRFFATTTPETDGDDCGCDTPHSLEDAGKFDTGDNAPIGKLLREAVLTNTEGIPVELGDYITATEHDATIVVFLRHLA